MDSPHWFVRHEADWVALVERLKLTPCPHCHIVGALVRHGSLTGYNDHTPPRPAVRGRRLFCSNRYRRPGCGRTVSVWNADTVRRSATTTRTLMAFLRRAATDGLAAALRAIPSPLSDRTRQRLWARFGRGQSRLRTLLFTRGPPPDLPPGSARRPDVVQLLAHLHAAFPDADCPLAAAQQATRSFVL